MQPVGKKLPRLAPFEPAPIRVAEVLSALSYALDLTEGQPMGHTVRTCVLGMRIAQEIGMPVEAQVDLYYALLMKDAGCSSNASRMFQILGTDDIRAKRDVKTTDWTKIGWESLEYALSHVRTGAPFLERVRALVEVAVNQKRNARELVQIRCERGANIARRMRLSEPAAAAIRSLDELWNGAGQPDGLRGEEIPWFSRIMNLAQNLDVFYMTQGSDAAIEMAEKRSGQWFDPDLVRAFLSISKDAALWSDVDNADRRAIDLEPRETTFRADEDTLDEICLAFADVIDAKSPFTYKHSTGVAGAAVAIGQTLGMTAQELVTIRRAGLLHDIGKLSVSNSILDKPGKLTDQEWVVVKQHPYYTLEILRRIPGFRNLSDMAASHHEKLDGSGYFRHLTADHLSLPARILVVADIFDALHARRPYRDALPTETVFAIMQKDAPLALDADCFKALQCSSGVAETISASLQRLALSVSEEELHASSPQSLELTLTKKG